MMSWTLYGRRWLTVKAAVEHNEGGDETLWLLIIAARYISNQSHYYLVSRSFPVITSPFKLYFDVVVVVRYDRALSQTDDGGFPAH